VLLHGGGNSRQDWHEAGYVKRLQDHFTVITLDLRGHGESGLPIEEADYTIDKMVQDILAVADACGVEHFSVWGFSFGGKVARYLAAYPERVDKIMLMGPPLGQGVSDEFRQFFENFCTYWPPILQAQRDGVLDLEALSQDDREFLGSHHVHAMIAWGKAMIHWPAIEPADFLCPTLWLVGLEDTWAMASVRNYEQALKGSKIQCHIIEGLNHGNVFREIDKVFATMLAFTQS
jgi:pimeloyl-ACP methyl ester carboxylesterase